MCVCSSYPIMSIPFSLLYILDRSFYLFAPINSCTYLYISTFPVFIKCLCEYNCLSKAMTLFSLSAVKVRDFSVFAFAFFVWLSLGYRLSVSSYARYRSYTQLYSHVSTCLWVIHTWVDSLTCLCSQLASRISAMISRWYICYEIECVDTIRELHFGVWIVTCVYCITITSNTSLASAD